MKPKQLTIDGGWEDVDKEPEIKPAIRTIRGKFREKWGTLEGSRHTCSECIHFIERKWDRKYFKCEVMGLSNCPSTDIRKSDKPCKLFRKKESDRD